MTPHTANTTKSQLESSVSIGCDRCIIFLHIPKTAGTTLHRVIERQYPPERIHSFGAHAQESVRRFKGLPKSRRGEIQVLKGHMAFGLHKFLPQPSTYITLVRDPIERTISYYYHIVRNPTHYLHEEVMAQKMSLKDVLYNEMTPDLDNGQTRLLSGVWNDVPCGYCSADMLERAKRNIQDHFAVVGLVGEFDKTLILLMRVFGWKWRNSLCVKANVAPTRPHKEDLSQGALDVIEQYNELDLELYDFAQAVFEERIGQFEHLTLQFVLFKVFRKLCLLE